VRGSDYVLLVTEPTPFGLNDLTLAVETVRALKIPFGVVINRADIGDDQTMHYCQLQRIDVLAEIPDDRQVAKAYSRGEMICEAIPTYRGLYSGLLNQVETRIARAR
jgi:MinD superfamily P-loop ATPase